MPNPAVRANARTLPKAIQSTPAGKSWTAGASAPFPTVRPATTPAAPSASPAFDLAQARADWRAACAKYGAAEKHYLEMCLNPPEPMLERDAVRSKRLEEIYEHEDKLVPLHRGLDGFKLNGGLGGPRARPESQCCARRPGSA